MLCNTVRVVWILLSLHVIFAFPSTNLSVHQDVQPMKLLAINANHYEAAMGLQRRDAEDFSSLSPQEQSQLIYGSPVGTLIRAL